MNEAGHCFREIINQNTLILTSIWNIYFLQKQDYKDAQSQFLRALELDEELSDSYYYLAKVYEGMGNAEQALDHDYRFQKNNCNETGWLEFIERIESLQHQLNR